MLLGTSRVAGLSRVLTAPSFRMVALELPELPHGPVALTPELRSYDVVPQPLSARPIAAIAKMILGEWDFIFFLSYIS